MRAACGGVFGVEGASVELDDENATSANRLSSRLVESESMSPYVRLDLGRDMGKDWCFQIEERMYQHSVQDLPMSFMNLLDKLASTLKA